MIDFDITRAFDDPDYPGLQIGATFVEMKEYLDRLVELVPYARDQALVRVKAEFKRQRGRLSLDDVKEKLDEIKWVAEDLVPRFFMGGFVIALYAAYESSIVRIAAYVRDKAKVPLKIEDLRETSTHKRVDLYLRTLLGEGFALPEELGRRLEELNDVRNCLAHTNGRVSVQNERRRQRLEALAQTERGATVRNDALVIDESFARAYLSYAATAVNRLLGQVHAKYAPRVSHGEG